MINPLFAVKAQALIVEMQTMIDLRRSAEYATFNFGPYGFDTLDKIVKVKRKSLAEILNNVPGASTPEKWILGCEEFIAQLEQNWPYFGSARTRIENVKKLIVETGNSLMNAAKNAGDAAPFVGIAIGAIVLWRLLK